MIKIEWPPNIVRIAAVFPSVGVAYADPKHPDAAKGVLFAYGEDIYNPFGVILTAPLRAHEYRHCARQWQTDPEAWWEKYLTDDGFRYSEELIAHVEEYIVQAKATTDRNQRARLEMRTAARLIAPLYNYKPARSLSQAVKDIHFLAH